jgi:hypothetical protein
MSLKQHGPRRKYQRGQDYDYDYYPTTCTGDRMDAQPTQDLREASQVYNKHLVYGRVLRKRFVPLSATADAQLVSRSVKLPALMTKRCWLTRPHARFVLSLGQTS